MPVFVPFIHSALWKILSNCTFHIELNAPWGKGAQRRRGNRTNVFEGNRQKWETWRPGQHLRMHPPKKNQNSKVKINIWAQYFHHLFLWLCWVLVASGLNCFTASEILIPYFGCCCCCCSVTSDSLQTHRLQHLRLPCLPLSPEVCSNSCPLSRWHHPTI